LKKFVVVVEKIKLIEFCCCCKKILIFEKLKNRVEVALK